MSSSDFFSQINFKINPTIGLEFTFMNEQIMILDNTTVPFLNSYLSVVYRRVTANLDWSIQYDICGMKLGPAAAAKRYCERLKSLIVLEITKESKDHMIFPWDCQKVIRQVPDLVRTFGDPSIRVEINSHTMGEVSFEWLFGVLVETRAFNNFPVVKVNGILFDINYVIFPNRFTTGINKKETTRTIVHREKTYYIDSDDFIIGIRFVNELFS